MRPKVGNDLSSLGSQKNWVYTGDQWLPQEAGIESPTIRVLLRGDLKNLEVFIF